MSNYLVLRGSGTQGNGYVWTVHNTDNPTLDVVMEVVERCRTGRGSLRLWRVDGAEPNEPEIELQSEDGRYLVLMTEIDTDGNEEILSFCNHNVPKDPVERDRFRCFRGELFPAPDVVTDFDLVRRGFREFVETGTISPELMPR